MQSSLARSGACCCTSSASAAASSAMAAAAAARPFLLVSPISSPPCSSFGARARPQARPHAAAFNAAWPLAAHNNRHPLCLRRDAAAVLTMGPAAAARAPRAASSSGVRASASSSAAAGKQQQQQQEDDDLAAAAANDDDEFQDEDEGDEDEDEEEEDYGGEQGQGLRAPAAPPPLDAAALQLSIDLARVASATKAADVMVLDVAPLVSWTSYLVIASVASRPQLMAVLARCEQAAAAAGYDKRNTPSGRSQWECVDFGSVVVHVMTPPQREAYALEDFYGAADEVQWWEDGQEEGAGRGDEGAAAGGAAGVWTTKQ